MMPSESNRPLKVFLCHASADRSKVRKIYKRLAAEGWIDPWLDVKKILPGQHWTTVIKQSLAEADSVIIFLSAHSTGREGFVQREMNFAWDQSLYKPRQVIYLIPIRLEECEVPYDLQERQWADYFGDQEEETYLALLESLKLRRKQVLRLESEEAAREEKKRREREALEKVAREKAEKEAAEKAVREKVELEAAEKAAREKAEREAAEKAAHEKAKKEVVEKIAREKAEREAAEKAAREKAKREKAKHRAARRAFLMGKIAEGFSFLKSRVTKAFPALRILGILGILSLLLWIGSIIVQNNFPLLQSDLKTAISNHTQPAIYNKSPSLVEKTVTPKLRNTITPSLTSTMTSVRINGKARQAINVRIAPSTTSYRIGTLVPGEDIVIIGRYENEGESHYVNWFLINLSNYQISSEYSFRDNSNLTGWVWADFIELEGEIEDVPYLDAKGDFFSSDSILATIDSITVTKTPTVTPISNINVIVSDTEIALKTLPYSGFGELIAQNNSGPMLFRRGDSLTAIGRNVKGDWLLLRGEYLQENFYGWAEKTSFDITDNSIVDVLTNIYTCSPKHEDIPLVVLPNNEEFLTTLSRSFVYLADYHYQDNQGVDWIHLKLASQQGWIRSDYMLCSIQIFNLPINNDVN